MKRAKIGLLLGLTFTLVAGLAFAALPRALAESASSSNSIYLSLDNGAVKGESIDAAHRDWIVVNSFEWSVDRPATTASGAGAGPASSRALVLTKYADASTPGLLQAVTQGTSFRTAVLSICQAINGTPYEYMKITMSNVQVVSVKITASAGGRAIDTVTLQFYRVSFAYTKRDQSTGTASGTIQCSWDFAASRSL